MLNVDTHTMRQMFLLGAMYASKATREAVGQASMDDLFVTPAIREAAEEVAGGKKPDGVSAFDKLMRRMAVDNTPANATAITRLMNTLQREADDNRLEHAVNRFRISKRLHHAGVELKFRKELEELLAKQQGAAIDEPAKV